MKPIHIALIALGTCAAFVFLIKLGRPANRLEELMPIVLPSTLTSADMIGDWERVGMQVGTPLTEAPSATVISGRTRFFPDGTFQGETWFSTNHAAAVGNWVLDGTQLTVMTRTTNLLCTVSVTNNLLECHVKHLYTKKDQFIYYRKNHQRY